MTEMIEHSATTIKTALDHKVVGQEIAKRQMSVLLSMHLRWFTSQNRSQPSPNAILVGPSGVGKTHTIRTACDFLGIPFVVVDSTAMVPAGIVGVQVEDILSELLTQAIDLILSRDPKLAERVSTGAGERLGMSEEEEEVLTSAIDLARQGIVFFDEFDKLAVDPKSRSPYSGAGESVQRRLLKLADGSSYAVKIQGGMPSLRKEARVITFDTAGLLLIGGGAFIGIDSANMRSRRPQELSRLLAKTNPNVVVSADVVNYGFLHELVARFPIIIELTDLTRGHLEEILRSDEMSPFAIWQTHFDTLGKQLSLSQDASAFIVDTALALKLGARGLHQVLFPGMAEIAFELESSGTDEIVITPDMLLPPKQRVEDR